MELSEPDLNNLLCISSFQPSPRISQFCLVRKNGKISRIIVEFMDLSRTVEVPQIAIVYSHIGCVRRFRNPLNRKSNRQQTNAAFTNDRLFLYKHIYLVTHDTARGPLGHTWWNSITIKVKLKDNYIQVLSTIIFIHLMIYLMTLPSRKIY